MGKESNAPQYADDVFEGTSIIGKEFNEKLDQLEKACIEKKPKTFKEEADIILEFFTTLDELAMLSVLMNRNFLIAMTRLQTSEANNIQISQLLDQVMSRAQPANITKSGLILPNR